jgi:transposase
VASFSRQRPSRKPFQEHLPRERVIVPGPVSCDCCGGARLSKLGEDVTETLEVIPKSWKVIQQVREKFSCQDCEKISQSPAPFHVIARGWAGPSLLAMVLFEKYGQHQPLNRQAERYAKEGVPISPVDAGRPGWRLHDRADADVPAPANPCAGRRAVAR